MKNVKLIGLFLVGFVVGAIAAGSWSGNQFLRMTVPKEVEAALQAAKQAAWLAGLRLGETEDVIKELEASMDNEVSTIILWADARPPDAKSREARDKFLRSVKVYRESYPATGDSAARINALLATVLGPVPGRDPQRKCDTALCRLNDRRLAALNTNTNAP